MDDPYNLQRFLDAQAEEFEAAHLELLAGSKEGHWMWFIFPQMKGLGRSNLSTYYGISSREEAEAYLKHSILGPRLIECTRLVNVVDGKTANDIFGYPDDLKFHSSVTLFNEISSDSEVFKYALEKYFGGKLDRATLDLLE